MLKSLDKKCDMLHFYLYVKDLDDISGRVLDS